MVLAGQARVPPPAGSPGRLNLSGASIVGGSDDAPGAASIVLPNQHTDIFHFAIDIGGSLIKLVYFSRLPVSSRPPKSLWATSSSRPLTSPHHPGVPASAPVRMPGSTSSSAPPPPSLSGPTSSSTSTSSAPGAPACSKCPPAGTGTGTGTGALVGSDQASAPLPPAKAQPRVEQLQAPEQQQQQQQQGFQRGVSALSPSRGSSFAFTGGRLHFAKFETDKLHECLDFIKSKRLHCYSAIGMDSDEESLWGYGEGGSHMATIKATGGGAFKYADVFRSRLGVTLEKEDEMECLVKGLNFLIRTVRDEAFTHVEGQKKFAELQQDVFPYLLVNIGSGVSILKVDGPREYQRVSGTNLGGGSFWGLGRLLTGCKNFDDILELSQRGDNSAVDMLVGDIYGGLDYSKIGLSASTIASSFGKVVGDKKELEEYRPQDMALSLLRMISYNIGQIAYLNALRYGLKRIFFGGFFIRGHAYTMDTISFAIKFWSKGEMDALFLRHEGYLGALGAFLTYEGPTGVAGKEGGGGHLGLASLTPSQLVERFPVGAPLSGGEIRGPLIDGVSGKVSWVEKFMVLGKEITGPSPVGPAGRPGGVVPGSRGARAATTGLGGFSPPLSALGAAGAASGGGVVQQLASDEPGLTVGVLHLIPTLEAFPLLAHPLNYDPNTLDLFERDEREYWLGLLLDHIPNLVEKAVASEGATEEAKRRGDAFGVAFRAHLERLRGEPASYGKLGLATLLNMREETLREFDFFDAYKQVKQRENEASLAVLPDLLADLDATPEAGRLLALVEGVLAANIFDWGSKECVRLYQSGTILEIYRMSRAKMKRPWRVDDFDQFQARWLAASPPPYRRALLFVDNAGADFVLGMLPLARELLRKGASVVLVANSLPAINDMTEPEMYPVLAEAAKVCGILGAALTQPGGALASGTGTSSPSVGTRPEGHSLLEQEGPASVLPPREEESALEVAHPARVALAALQDAGVASVGGREEQGMGQGLGLGLGADVRAPEAAGEGPVLSVVGSGSGGPCLDFRQVSSELASVARTADLVVLEGMGRCLHTNFRTQFTCDTLKLAMIKNDRLAHQLIGGKLFDCVCKFERP